MNVKPDMMKINQPTDDNAPKLPSIRWRFHPERKSGEKLWPQSCQ